MGALGSPTGPNCVPVTTSASPPRVSAPEAPAPESAFAPRSVDCHRFGSQYKDTCHARAVLTFGAMMGGRYETEPTLGPSER